MRSRSSFLTLLLLGVGYVLAVLLVWLPSPLYRLLILPLLVRVDLARDTIDRQFYRSIPR